MFEIWNMILFNNQETHFYEGGNEIGNQKNFSAVPFGNLGLKMRNFTVFTWRPHVGESVGEIHSQMPLCSRGCLKFT